MIENKKRKRVAAKQNQRENSGKYKIKLRENSG